MIAEGCVGSSHHSTAGLQEPATNQPPTMEPPLLPNATLDFLGNDLIIRCASYLDADGLAQLGRTSARFGTPQAGQQRSLVNEIAHQQFQQSATDEERVCLPKYGGETYVGLYRALELLRRPLRFDELVGNGFSPQEHPASVTSDFGSWSTAMSRHVMRDGRHFVEFTLTHDNAHLGIIRPVSFINGTGLKDWGGLVSVISSNTTPAVSAKLRSQRTAKWGDSNVHCWTYCRQLCAWTDWNNKRGSIWQELENLGSDSAVGLLLDLDEGTLSVCSRMAVGLV